VDLLLECAPGRGTALGAGSTGYSSRRWPWCMLWDPVHHTTVRSSSYVLSVLLGCPLECALVSLPRSPWQNISWNTAAAVVLFTESQSSSAFTLPLFYPCLPKCTLDLWWTFLDRNGGVLSGMPLTTDLLLAPFSEVHDAAVALLLCSTGSEDWC
jgi:hypothetical protein